MPSSRRLSGGLESEAGLAILARSLTDHPSEHG